MNALQKYRLSQILRFLVALLLIPALFWKLGDPILIEDESIRGLVAQEMVLNDNYVSPTLNSEYYYKKPPLFNWLIVASYQMTGEVSEWSVRLPSVISLILFCVLVFLIGCQYLGREMALLAALAVLTNGRMLFYDSMLGLIDISFSLTIFLLFWVIYHFSERHQWLWMFVLSYFLMTVAFFFKGLPAIAFQGLTLVAWLVYRGNWKKLFSWMHGVGLLVPLALVGLYLMTYAGMNDPWNLLEIIVQESSNATALKHSFFKSIQHVFLFPFDLIYHFLPWSLLLLLLFQKSAREHIVHAPFLGFCLVVVLANIWIYWISPRVFPRYLFMFLPLLFYIAFDLYGTYRNRENKMVRIIEVFLSIILIVTPILIPIALASNQMLTGLDLWDKVALIGCTVIFVFIALIYWRLDRDRMLAVVVFLLAFRVLFNGFIIPERVSNPKKQALRQETIEAGLKYKDQSLAIIGKEDTYDQYSYYTNSFYLSMDRKEAITRIDRNEVKPEQYYILDPFLDDRSPYIVLDSFPIRHQDKYFYIVKK